MLTELSPLLFSLAIALGLNLMVFVFAFSLQTDKLTDLTYSLTFALMAVLAWQWYGVPETWYRTLMMAMPMLWALRLGSYLFVRILGKGKDDRFDGFRHVWWKFGGFYLLQGVSAWIIGLPFLLALSSTTSAAEAALFSPWLYAGLGIFLFGWIVEGVADWQKYRFKTDPAHQGEFMRRGLFSIVRFPNYAGEILVWIGVFVATVPVLSGWEWLAAISPIWIASLLIGVSGIPQLEAAHEEKYGDREEFQAYKEEKDKLVPGVY